MVLEWKVNSAAPPTEVEVRFSPDGDGTRVELEHRGWEQYPTGGADERGSYDTGWSHPRAVPGGDLAAIGEQRQHQPIAHPPLVEYGASAELREAPSQTAGVGVDRAVRATER